MLPPPQRQELALGALARTQTISQLSRTYEVSRKFIYQQADKGREALNGAFARPEPAGDQVLFHLPVTEAWLRQVMLGLVLIGHSSLRGVVELFRDLFDMSVSVGTVHNVLQSAVDGARQHNRQQDLASIRIGAHDEIFQSGRPVLVGADVASTYCYLLSLEEHRDADTWAIRMLELADQGFHPEATIADFGPALRAGQKEAFPDVPCRGDLFHLMAEVQELLGYCDNRAYEAIAARSRWEHQQARFRQRQGRSDPKRSQHLRHARLAEASAITGAEEVAVLIHWLIEDVLPVAGPELATRRILFDFIVDELEARQSLCPQRLASVCRLLRHQRDTLLAFAEQLDRDLMALAERWQVSAALVRELLQVQALEPQRRQRWQRDADLHRQLGARYYPLSQAVAELARQTIRASSVIENLNSRLRGYFFLRRHLGPDYLALLQFFLNHRRFIRSERPERVGKSPAELLTGERHPHWLEMLGYSRFSRN